MVISQFGRFSNASHPRTLVIFTTRDRNKLQALSAADVQINVFSLKPVGSSAPQCACLGVLIIKSSKSVIHVWVCRAVVERKNSCGTVP